MNELAMGTAWPSTVSPSRATPVYTASTVRRTLTAQPALRSAAHGSARLARVALYAAASLWLPACASAPLVPEAASPVAAMETEWTPPLERLTSPEAFGLVRVDMRALAATPLFAHLEQQLALLVQEDWSEADIAYTREFVHRVDELLWSVEGVPGGPLDDVTVLLRGRFTDADLDHLADTDQHSTYEGHPLRADGAWSIALLGDHTLALGPLRLVEGICDRFDGRSPAGPPMHAAMIASRARAGYGQHTLGYAIRAEPSPYVSQERYAEAIVSNEGYCDLTAGLDCHLGVTVSDSAALAPLEDALQRVLDVFNGQAPVFRISPGLTAMVQGATFTTEERRLVLHLSASAEGARDALDGVLELLTTHMNSLFADPNAP
ncbi:MAG: hypothetical protein KC593_14030 [Myxococcales bacterium]|nr:hypothetical protein [Myxococcales bacterium]